MISIPGVKRGELKESLKIDPNKVSRLSWSEQLLAKAATSHESDIIRYGIPHYFTIIIRATPLGFGVDVVVFYWSRQGWFEIGMGLNGPVHACAGF